MHGIVLVVVSVAEPNRRCPSPISSRAEHHSLNIYETMKLCKRSMMEEVEGPIRLCQVLFMFQLEPKSVRECCAKPVLRAAVVVCMHSRNCIIDIILIIIILISCSRGDVSKSPDDGDFFRLVLV